GGPGPCGENDDARRNRSGERPGVPPRRVRRGRPRAHRRPRRADEPAADGGPRTFGLQGPGLEVVDRDMLPADGDYGFEAGKVYNLAGGRYSREGGGFSGAHSDIARPEVAHAVWQAAGV